jgi:hypothetical protein
MKAPTLRRLDATSAALLLLWTGMALGFGALGAPLLFKLLPSRDLAGQVAGATVVRLDWAAWIAFGGAFLCSYLPRWLAEVQETEAVGPLRLWTAGALAALLICLASSFIITPRIQEIRSSLPGPVETLAPGSALRAAHAKAHRFSTQFFFLRLILAFGLAAGLPFLPGIAADSGKPEESAD